MEERHRDIALFRYALIREAADPALSPRQRGALVRALAEADHVGPGGRRIRVTRSTLDRWIKTWSTGGFEALAPARRSASPATPLPLLELAEALKRENPRRTAALIAILIAESHPGVSTPAERTIQRHLAAIGLNRIPTSVPRVYGRFEAERPNELWTGDVLHGPALSGAKTYLFAFIDDHSRALVGYRFGHAEDVLRLEAALRAGFSSRGSAPRPVRRQRQPVRVPLAAQGLRQPGHRLGALQAGRAGLRGKIERVFATVRSQFLTELTHRGVASLAGLNDYFAAWVEGVYHRRVHSETGQAPLERFLAGGAPALPSPADLRAAFLWSETRTVTKTATVNLHGNRYEVPGHLVGAKVELVFDPFDLTDIKVRHRGKLVGVAVAHQIRRHTHPQARPAVAPPPRPTGIDYLKIVKERYDEDSRRRISYADLPPDELPGGTEEEVAE